MYGDAAWSGCVSGVVLCGLSELSSAQRVLRDACSDTCSHVAIQLAVLEQLAACFLAQVSQSASPHIA